MGFEGVEGIALVLLLAVVLHQLMALPQVRRMRKELAEIKSKGPATSVGMSKSWKGRRYYALVSDLDGNLIEGYATGGSSVFAGFRLDASFEQEPVRSLIERLEAKENPDLIDQAKLMAAKQLENGLAKRVGSKDETEGLPPAGDV